MKRIYLLGAILFFMAKQGYADGTVSNAEMCITDAIDKVTITTNLSCGTVIRWEKSPSPYGPWEYVNATLTSLVVAELEQTTYFRAVGKTKSGDICYSAPGKVSVYRPSDPGQISRDKIICLGEQSGTLTTTGYRATSLQWQYKPQGTATWLNCPSTTHQYNTGTLTETTAFRLEAKNGVCPVAHSNESLITVSPKTQAGTISNDTLLCAGNNTGKIKINKPMGEILRWESSQTGNAPWSEISNTSNAQAYTNLKETTYFKALVKSGACPSKYTSTVKVSVSPKPQKGFVVGSTTVCTGKNSSKIGVLGQTGEIAYWQYSEDGEKTWKKISSNQAQLEVNDLKKTRTYRAAIQSSPCQQIFTDPITITVKQLPMVDFAANTVCLGIKTSFKNKASLADAAIKRFEWEFGDGAFASVKDPDHLYTKKGKYKVRLIAESENGCIAEATKDIIVYEKPVANFKVDEVCLGNPSNLTNNSLSSLALETKWDLGDNSPTSTESSPAHTYTNPGTYTIKLNTKNQYGCTDSISKETTVHPMPEADFHYNNTCMGFPIKFNNKSKIKTGSMTFQWQMGDKQTSTEISPLHQYATTGSYQVFLFVKSDKGCQLSVNKFVEVFETPIIDFEAPNICHKDSLRTKNTSSATKGLNYTWDFGDKNSSNKEQPAHYYKEPGKYRVKLSGKTEKGCQASKTKEIEIYALPQPNFLVENTCDGTAMEFRNMSTGIKEYSAHKWQFGDKNSSDKKAPSHLYASHGIYTVKLIVSNQSCSDSIQKDVQVFPGPVAKIGAKNVCFGNRIEFQDLSSITEGSISEWKWDFGDGTNAIRKDPNKLYVNPGKYKVSLEVKSSTGCTGKTIKDIEIYQGPIASFSAKNVCIGQAITFTNNSVSKAGTANYKWSFADGATSKETNPKHTYKKAGNYKVKLYAISEFNCIDSLTRNIEAYPLPKVNAGKDISISKGKSALLRALGADLYHWSPTTGLSNTVFDTTTASPLLSTSYTLRGQSKEGCVNYDTIHVKVNDDYLVNISNVFTPDGNGQNDTWHIENIESYGNCFIRIFDRWGNQVFSKNGYRNDWDGRNRKGDILPDGTYYYVITFSGSDKVFKGAVTLLRNK